MQRLAMDKLAEWKNSPYRKPLILKGVRQVGKTWLLKEFGRISYKNTAYFNFDENPEYREFFASTKDVRRIVPNLSLAGGEPTLHKDLPAFSSFCVYLPARPLPPRTGGPRSVHRLPQAVGRLPQAVGREAKNTVGNLANS